MEKDTIVNSSRQSPLPSEDRVDTEMTENLDPAEVRSGVLPLFRRKSDVGGKFVGLVGQLQKKVGEILCESRVSKERRAEIEKEFLATYKIVEGMAAEELKKGGMSHELENEVSKVLAQRGIETCEEWDEYIKTMERDGEVLAGICEMLNTDVLQVKKHVASLQLEAVRKDEAMEVQGRTVEASAVGEGVFNNQLQMHSTGPIYADRLRQPSASTDSTTPALEDAGSSVSQQLITYLRSMACSDPGVYRGTKNENFEEFLRRFKRKYEQVIKCEATLIEILGDDHLAGRAKSIFAALPRITKEQGLDAVTREMARLLSYDSTAGRMRALTDLKNLKLRPHQEIAEFCAVLEKLGRQANPECTVEDRSLEYAQILLENLREWPEHYQLVGALHKVDPRRAYEEVKQLALSIEQSKIMFEVGRRPADLKWKERAAQYRGYGFVERAGAPSFSRSRPEQGRDTPNRGEELGGRGNYQSSVSITREPQRQARNVRPAQHGSSQEGVENRKCYKCSKYGHVARDCPVRTARVNQIEPREEAPSRKDETLSAIVNRARCMGMSVREKGVSADELIGEKVTVPLNILNEDCQALIDTGSMISIVPVELLAKVQDKGFDLDSLGMVPKSKLKPVVDASNNRMDFLAAVYLPVKLNQETTQNVAFHISPKKEMEIILGTNALARLGINISIERERDSSVNKSVKDEANESKVVVAERRYIPPGDTALVEVLCQGDRGGEVERVIWPCKHGIAAGVFTIKDRRTSLPVFNKSCQPILLKEGEDVGRWGTDKWLERWEEANPLLMGAREDNLRAPERLRVLEELIADNMEPGSMDEDLQRLLEEYAEAFAVSDQELSQTDLVHMTINTGDSPPIK
ncbi:zinc knuckle [Ostertagia ostertagi]